MIPLAVWEQVIDASGVAPRIEALLPIGVRGRQLKVRTLLAGMCLAQADHRPAHLTRVHQALTGLSDDDQRRLGVVADWKHGPHLLTCRQTERTSGLVAAALGKDEPGGLPAQALQAACDDLLEASVPEEFKDASSSLAVDWTDLESFSRPPPARGGPCADPEASWGHRKNNLLRSEDELFFGYYLSAAHHDARRERPRRPRVRPPRHAVVVPARPRPRLRPGPDPMPAAGIRLGDILTDSGYAHRDAGAWALPLRDAGASLVQDLHPHDRGPKGTHDGAIISQRQPVLPVHAPLAAGTRAARPATPPARRPPRTTPRPPRLPATSSASITRDDADGYHRVQCPAAMGKIRCPLRPVSMSLDRDRPGNPPAPGQPPGLLHPADHHRPAGGRRQDGAEARLPLRGAPPLLHPPHRRRARLRHRQGPRHQRPSAAAGAASWAWRR